MKKPAFSSSAALSALTVLLGLLLSGCGGGTTAGNPAVEDSSVSGAAASAAGGALSGSSANGTQAQMMGKATSWRSGSVFATFGSAFDPWPEALAATTCPTYKSGTTAGCSASGDTLWLEYNDCHFGLSGSSTWNGTLALIVSPGTNVSCGQFPKPSSFPGSLYRQYVSTAGSNTPGSVTITSAYGTTVTIDNSSTNGTLSNFAQASISPIVNNGYGAEIHFNSSQMRDQITLDHNENDGKKLDLTITGQLDIAETAGGTTGSKTVSGSITIYHNYLRVIATSTFQNVIHDNSCCFPISGTINTTFSDDPSDPPTSEGSKAIGKTETLTLTGCGTGTLQSYEGTTTQVVLTRCF